MKSITGDLQVEPSPRRHSLDEGFWLPRDRTSRRDRQVRPLAVAAISWSLSFAAIHVAWAPGSSVGLGGRRVTGVLLAIDFIAIPLCLLAAGTAWQLRDTCRAVAAPRLVSRMAWMACLVLSLRGLGTLQALVAPTTDATTRTRLVDPFFLVGGVLFGFLARGSAPGGPWPVPPTETHVER